MVRGAMENFFHFPYARGLLGHGDGYITWSIKLLIIKMVKFGALVAYYQDANTHLSELP
jgi:hypothetical protein